VETNKRC